MNKGSRWMFNILWILLSIIVLSCAEKTVEMDTWETEMAKQLEATEVQLYQMSTATSVNGIPTESDRYLELKIVNSTTLEKIGHNKRLLDEQCDEIKNTVLNIPAIQEFPSFNELRISIVEKTGVIFKSEKRNTMTYNVH